MPKGKLRTDAERKARHKRLYGNTNIPKVVKEALLSDKRILVVAPTYELTQIIFDQVIIFLDRILSSSDYSIIKKPVPKIQLANGSIIECKSSENSKGMMGRAVDLIVIDEASRVGEDIK